MAHIDRRMNDMVRKRTWLRVAGLAVLASGLRQAGVADGALPSLLPVVAAQGGVALVTDRQCSRQQASDWFRWAVSQAGGDSNLSSGISAREGGISTAIEGGRGDSVAAERALSSASRPRVHAPNVARPLPRNF